MSSVTIGRYARVTLDAWFKRTFGTESHKRLLHLFLQELLPEHEIEEISLDPSEHTNPNESKKDIRVDVECHDKDGTRFVVEMQLADQEYFYERAVFNSSFAILQQKKKGERSYDFPTVYVVGIMNFTKHEGSDRVDYRYTLREAETNELMTSRIQYILLELPNSVHKALTPEATLLENFCYALYQMEHFEEKPSEFVQEIFELLFDYAEIATFTPEEKIQYELDMTTEQDRINQLAYAEKKATERGMAKGLAKGLAEGLAEGLAKGLAEGRTKGLAEGRAEGAQEKAWTIARNLIESGVPVNTVVKCTGLSQEELQDQMNRTGN